MLFGRSVLFSLVAALSGCKSSGGHGVRSIIGLEAGQEERLRGTAAPIFIGLSDWFQKFKTAGSGESETLFRPKVSKVRNALPKGYREGLTAYIDQQQKRISDMRQAIASDDQRRIERLLDLETREMLDIALVLIHPDYQPVTEDLLARYMAKARIYGNFTDVFAAQGYLDLLLKYWSIPDLAKDAERQRVLYLEELKNLYLKGDNHRGLLKVLDKSESSLVAMKSQLQNAGSSLSLTAESSPNLPQPVQGPVAILASFFGPLQRFLAANPALVQKTLESPLVPASAPQGTASTPGAVVPGQEGLNFRTFPGGSFVSGGANLTADQLQLAEGLHLTREGVITPAQPSEKFSIPEVKAPPIDCLKFGLEGEALIQCHRYAGFLNLEEPRGPGIQLSSDFDHGMPQLTLTGSGKNTTLLQYKVLAGAAEAGPGHVFQQGAVGSCTLQAAVGAAYISIARLGVDPKAVLPKNGQEINAAFASLQNSEPQPQAAFRTLEALLPGYEIQAAYLRDLQSMKESIDAGDPLFIGVNVDLNSWTNNRSSGGREFSLDRGFGLADSPRTMVCHSGPQWYGHAVIVVGYDGDDLLIKNSWGARWSDGGIARIDTRSCFAGPSFAYSVHIEKK